MNNKMLAQVAFWLTVVGAVNWGLVALLKLNIVTLFFEAESAMATAVYTVIAVSALYVGLMNLNKKK